MSQRLSARTEEAIETWQFVAEQLIREPVREAVREALADEGLSHRAPRTVGRSGDSSTDGGRSLLTPKLLLPLLGIAAALFYARRRKTTGEEPTEGIAAETGEPAATTAGRGATRSEPGGTGEGTGDEQEGDVEGSDEGATARS